MRGHGREMLQFGIPISEGPAEDENTTVTSGGKACLDDKKIVLFSFR